jgi:hypothetical protein
MSIKAIDVADTDVVCLVPADAQQDQPADHRTKNRYMSRKTNRP